MITIIGFKSLARHQNFYKLLFCPVYNISIDLAKASIEMKVADNS